MVDEAVIPEVEKPSAIQLGEATEDAPTVDPDVKTDPHDELPEWARESLKKANAEAASYRTQLREAQQNLSQAKTPEEFAAIQTTLAEVQTRLLIRDYTEGLPKEVIEAPYISWPSDEDGIKAVAEQLRAFVSQKAEGEAPQTGGALSGGLNPMSQDQPENLDPAYLAGKVRSHRNASF